MTNIYAIELVAIESPLRAAPYTGRLRWLPLVKRWVERQRYELNRRYARACMRDCVEYKQAGYASHLLFDQPGILDDTIPDQRATGIELGLAWAARAKIRAIYADVGCTVGMMLGKTQAEEIGQTIVRRRLGPTRMLAALGPARWWWPDEYVTAVEIGKAAP